MDKLPLEIQTLYSEMMEQLTTLEAQRSIGHAPGCFTTKTVKKIPYYYFQYSDPGGQVRQAYIGRKTPELDRVVERSRSTMEAVRVDLAHIQRLCALLRAGGAFVTDTPSARVLKALAESGVFHLDGVLIGTNAFAVLGNMLGVRWDRAALKTHDVDIASDLKMSIALANSEVDIPRTLERLEMGFIPVPPLNPKNPSTSFKVRGHPLRVDLLTPETDPDHPIPVFIPRFHAAAQPVRFLDYLIADPVKAVVIDGGGILVNVPQPARFAFHKLIVSREREITAHGKAEKDRMQAVQLISVLADERPGDLLLAWDELRKRGQRWLKRGIAGLSSIKKQHQVVYQQAAHLLKI